MPRGGKRPGAGAPKGNLNAIKDGRRSKQIARAVELALRDPRMRPRLLDLVRDALETG